MDLISTLFYYFLLLIFHGELFGGLLRARLLDCKEEGMFLGWEDFSPELIKKFIVELFGHVGSFSGNLVFS